MHVKVTHQNFRYICHVCTKEYKTSTSLQEHLLTHNADTNETPRIKCELCSSTFKNVKGLRKHLPIHNTHSAEVQCLQCSKTLPNRHKLIRHVANRHKVHKCQLCGREFIRSDQLKVWPFIHINTASTLDRLIPLFLPPHAAPLGIAFSRWRRWCQMRRNCERQFD